MAKDRPDEKRKRSDHGPPKLKKNRPDRDRRVRQADRLARILRVLELIQSRGRWTTKAIAEELECSERTVYRDLDVLKFAGIPYYREGTQQFIRVRPDFRFPVLTLSPDEVLGLSLAAAVTNAPGLDVTAGADPTVRKLAATSGQEFQDLMGDAAQLVMVLDLKLADHSRHHEAIRTVQSALIQRHQIGGVYESPYEDAPVKLKLHPYRLCLIKNAWYVVGTTTEKEPPRTYRVARFKALRLLNEEALIPEDFDLRAYFGNAWAVYRGEMSYDVELWFPPEAAKVVTETVWHHTQKLTRTKNGVILKFRVDGLEEILNWVLSWTGQVKVIGPSELQGRMIQRLEEAIALNRSSVAEMPSKNEP